MNRRTCACGTVIVCADLDGYDIWLDQRRGGWISVDRFGRAEVGTGPWRRHSCAHDPRPLDPKPLTATQAKRNALSRGNSRRVQASAARALDAIRAVTAAGAPLSRRERHAALARLDHPDASCAELAIVTGLSTNAVQHALYRIVKQAQHLTSQAA